MIYENFASVYDDFMADTPYDLWYRYLKDIWKKTGVKPKSVLDLACGTGTLTSMLAADGFDCIGVDLSEDMLAVAKSKAEKNNLDILFLRQEMQSFELYGTVDTVICICDGINYLLNESDVLKTFKLVENYLEYGGIFIFDINTRYKFEKILNDNTFAESTENSAYIWENFFDSVSCINEFSTVFFIKKQNNLFEKFEEIHYERAYEIGELKILLENAGLEFIACYDELTFRKPSRKSERIFLVAKRKHFV